MASFRPPFWRSFGGGFGGYLPQLADKLQPFATFEAMPQSLIKPAASAYKSHATFEALSQSLIKTVDCSFRLDVTFEGRLSKSHKTVASPSRGDAWSHHSVELCDSHDEGSCNSHRFRGLSRSGMLQRHLWTRMFTSTLCMYRTTRKVLSFLLSQRKKICIVSSR